MVVGILIWLLGSGVVFFKCYYDVCLEFLCNIFWVFNVNYISIMLSVN